MGKALLYYNTIKYMKPSQVISRIMNRFGVGRTLGVYPSKNQSDIRNIDSPERLDFDPAYLSRFPIEELMKNKITILHSSKTIDWKSRWMFDDKSALWNFNLHYFEYLSPLIKAWKDTGDKRFLNKTLEMITGWIDSNPKGSSPAWSSYTIALRLVTWISWYGYVNDAIDDSIQQKVLSSLHDQYAYLVGHLEKGILGNHYFEDLKSLVLASLFFKEDAVFEKALACFKAECKEQILADGMHFELSPMYHKIILEGMLRVAVALRGAKKRDLEIESYLQPMIDVAYSFEEGIERVPLFNDSGNNVAKSLRALIETAKPFGITPHFKDRLISSGFYIFKKNVCGKVWKLIVDAGQPGPKYIPGHAHCDAMSYELFCDGKPMVMNCGTYAYQCKERGVFRSTASHNTVMVKGVEQSQCWGAFRVAKRSSTKVLNVTNHSIIIEMVDQKRNKIERKISFADELIVTDKSDGKELQSWVHTLCPVRTNSSVQVGFMDYAEDYGKKEKLRSLCLTGTAISYSISLID